MRSRALTTTVGRPDVTILVAEFRCQAHSISQTVGTAASHRMWRVRALGHGTNNTESAELMSAGAPDILKPGAAASSSTNRTLGEVSMEVTTDPGVGGVRGAVMGTRVSISADGNQFYPDNAKPGKAKMHDDWLRIWGFRGLYPGVGFVRPDELWVPGTVPTDVPSHAGDAAHFLQTRLLGDGNLSTMHKVQAGNERLPCVLTKQRSDGSFEVTAFRRDERGVWSSLEFPTMHKSNIFLTSTGQNISLPEVEVNLDVPRSSPQLANVTIEGESFSYHLGRASPPASAGQPRRVLVNVPKPVYHDVKHRIQQNVMGAAGIPAVPQQDPIHINVDAAELEHFLSGQVRRGDMICNRLQKDWVLQLGPFATHTIRLVKSSHMSAVMTVVVDDNVLVECLSTDLLGGDPNVFKCRFRFVGERIMDFNIHEETKDGYPLDSKSTVSKPYQYSHIVEIAYPHKAIDKLSDATMSVDGFPFEQLPSIQPVRRGQQGLSIVRTALQAQFPIDIPRKVVPEDTRNIGVQLGQRVVDKAGGWGAIGQNAQSNLSVAGGNFAKTMEDLGNNLSRLGLSAWEMMFMQNDAAAATQPARPSFPPRGLTTSASSEGPMAPPIRSMPTRDGMPRGYMTNESSKMTL